MKTIPSRDAFVCRCVGQKRAFTLTELLVVIALVTILASLLRPAEAGTKRISQGIDCLNNLKQLTLAAHLYAADFQDAICLNTGGSVDSWVAGGTAALNVTSLPGATNTASITKGLLWPYNLSLMIYKCPGDYDLLAGQVETRVRNYSLNGMMGSNQGFGADVHPGLPEHIKFSTVTNPGPASASFFVDEQSTASPSSSRTSIDDGYFAVDSGRGSMTAYNSSIWRNVPSSRHGNFGQFSYADGHAATMKWFEPDTRKLQGVDAASAEFINADKKQLWLSAYGSGTVTGVPW